MHTNKIGARKGNGLFFFRPKHEAARDGGCVPRNGRVVMAVDDSLHARTHGQVRRKEKLDSL